LFIARNNPRDEELKKEISRVNLPGVSIRAGILEKEM
jgi:hypothetical protein